jgi:hypothetical protein
VHEGLSQPRIVAGTWTSFPGFGLCLPFLPACRGTLIWRRRALPRAAGAHAGVWMHVTRDRQCQASSGLAGTRFWYAHAVRSRQVAGVQRGAGRATGGGANITRIRPGLGRYEQTIVESALGAMLIIHEGRITYAAIPRAASG